MAKYNIKDFGDYLSGYFEKDITGDIWKGIGDVSVETIEQGVRYGESALGKFEETGRGIETAFDELGKGNLGGAYLSAKDATESGKEALWYTGGATLGSVAAPFEIGIMGALQGISPTAAEGLGEGLKYVGEGLNVSYDFLSGEDEIGNKGLLGDAKFDTTLGMLPILGYKGIKAKREVETRTMQGAIEEAFSSIDKSGTTPARAEMLKNIISSLSENDFKLGRQVNSNDIIEAARDAGEDIPDQYNNFVVDRELDGVNESVADIVGERTYLNKSQYKGVLDAIEALGIDRGRAGVMVQNILKENQRMISKNVPTEVKVKESLNVVLGKSELGKDIDLKKFKYDKDGSVVGEAYAVLEEEGLMSRQLMEDGTYSFSFTEKGLKYLTPEERIKVAQGVAHFPAELYDEYRATRSPSTDSFEQVREKLLNEAIDNPEQLPEILNRIEEANGDVGKLKAPPTNKFLYDNIKDGLNDLEITGKALSDSVKSDIYMLGKRLGIEVDQLFNFEGKLDSSKLPDVIKQFDDANANKFKSPTQLPAPTTLKKMLRRDEKVAKAGYDKGVADQKAVLVEKIKRAVGDEKAKWIAKLDSLNRKIDWKANIRSLIKGLDKDGEYKFYGDTKAKNELLGKLNSTIEGIKSAKGYDAAMDKIESKIHEANANYIRSLIAKELAPFKRPAGKNTAAKRKIDAEVRMILEAAAIGQSVFKHTGNIEGLIGSLEDIKMLKKVGKAEWKKQAAIDDAEAAKIIDESTKDGLQELGNEKIDDVLDKSGNLIKRLYNWVDPVTAMYKLFKQNALNPAYNLVLEVMDAQRRNQLTKENFAKIANKFDKLGWVDKKSSRKIGIYLASLQSDWNSKIFNKDGEFIGQNIFPHSKFKDAKAYTEFMDGLKKEIEGNPKLMEVIDEARALYNEVGDKARTAAYIHDKIQYGRVDNHYPQSPIRGGQPTTYADNIFAGDAAGFKKGFLEERAFDTTVQYDPDFFRDFQRYINTQGLYGEMRGPWGNFMKLVNKGLLKDTNNFTRDLVKATFKDLANPEGLKPNWASKMSSVATKMLLMIRATTIISQGLSVPELSVRVSPSSIVEGVRHTVYPNEVTFKAYEASTALQLADGNGMMLNEMQRISDNNSIQRLFHRFSNWIMIPIGKADYLTKLNAFVSAYDDLFKKKYGKPFDYNNPEFTDRQLVLAADDVIEGVIGSQTYARIPPALRDPYMRALVAMQRFVIQRGGNMFYMLPDKFRKNKLQASTALATYAVTAVMPVVIGLGYKEALDYLAKVSGIESIGDDKSLEERLFPGVKEPGMSDIIMKLAEAEITASVPGVSNILSVMKYDSTGTLLGDYLKKPITKGIESYKYGKKAEEERAKGGYKANKKADELEMQSKAKQIEAISSIFGEPGRLIGEGVKSKMGINKVGKKKEFEKSPFSK